jgi:minichromosome maintenance protein 10
LFEIQQQTSATDATPTRASGGRGASSPLAMSHAFSTVASERARETKAREELRRQQQRVETTEKFSGLRIKNRLVASAVLEDKFADLRFARIPDVKLDMGGRWATAGVLVDKTMKQGSTGASYSIWKLSDMSPTDYVFTVFLFGQAHLDWHREDPGTVWAVVDGELREDTKAGPAGRPTAACNEPHQLCKLGASPVFGRCKGTRRDGNDCTMHVNAAVSHYCAFHAGAALKSLATERMALGPGRAAKFVRNGKTVVGARGRGGAHERPAGGNGTAERRGAGRSNADRARAVYGV